jgi:hypothetical protein
MKYPGIPVNDQERLEYHSSLFPAWLMKAGVELPLPNGNNATLEDIEAATPMLRSWYPYIYAWGPKGNVLVDNMAIIYQHLQEEYPKPRLALKNSFLYPIFKTYSDMAITDLHDKNSLRMWGDFAGVMLDHDLWNAMMGATDVAGPDYQVLLPKSLRNNNVVELTRRHMQYVDVHRLFRAKGAHERIDYGMKYFIRFILGGEHVADHPQFGVYYQDHVRFCEDYGLKP